MGRRRTAERATLSDDKRSRYEGYLVKAKANDWLDQVEHWESMLAQLDEDDE